jgi:2-polyprenyl-6-hydroxyphenyl methylase/3-demethylubiquinone-9 3-methyltransferase
MTLPTPPLSLQAVALNTIDRPSNSTVFSPHTARARGFIRAPGEGDRMLVKARDFRARARTQVPMTATANADPEELAKFERLAARWWDPHGEFKPLHDLNPLRLEFINDRAGLKGKRVLDVGCGGGILAEGMAALGAEVTGIDLAEAPLEVARRHLKESGLHVHYRRIAAEALAREMPAAFDVVTCLEMLEHVPNPASIVAACAALVRPGGQVFFSTINRHPKAFLFAIVGAEYILGLLPRGTHEYMKFIRPAELAAMARRAGLNLKELTGIHYNPLTRRFRLGPGVEVNYLAWCEKERDSS